jgi:uncharacterized membrane-anchored protein YjiN (DUF445 family)
VPLTTLSPSEQQRAGLLARGKRRATGLLLAVTAVFVISTVLVSRASWLSWVQATAVASMVGALADWFAVTALFRRPLGLPIPHTAIVVERKDRFGETLGSFVQESFLTPEAISERLLAAGAVPRAAAWLADPVRAEDLAGRLVDGLAAGADLLRDDDVHQVLATLIGEQLDRVALAPLAGRALSRFLADGRHQPMLDAGLAGLSRYLADHGPAIHARLGVSSPWWLPGVVEDRLFDRLLDQAVAVSAAMAADREHPLRLQLDTALATFADDLQHSKRLRLRGEELKADVLGHPQVRQYAAGLWRDIKEQLRTQSQAPDSSLRRQATELIVEVGARLRDDEDLAAGAQRGLDRVVRAVVGHFETELARLVSGTIARWDAADTSRRLELLLGPDLQYIRINGTVVGALAGLALHAVSRVLG